MKKVFIFKNLRTNQTKNVPAQDGNGKTALDNAIDYIVNVETWDPLDVQFIGSRPVDGNMDVPRKPTS